MDSKDGMALDPKAIKLVARRHSTAMNNTSVADEKSLKFVFGEALSMVHHARTSSDIT